MFAKLAPSVALGLLFASGCVPTRRADVRDKVQDGAVTQASYSATDDARSSRRIAPRRCGLSIAILSRPAKDHALNEGLWPNVDEQSISPEAVRTLRDNGMRAGLITGALPIEVEGVLNPRPPGQKVDIVKINLPDGDQTDVALSTQVEPMTLLLNRDGRTIGRDYEDAKGLLRITASHDGNASVRLKIVPEVHHGPVRQGYAAAPNSGPFQPREFMLKNGQTEESFADLAATIAVKPGQAVVVGGRSDSGLGLGGFLFTQAEANSDRVLQRVVLIWAEPTEGINPLDSADKDHLAFGPKVEAEKPERLRGPIFSQIRKAKDVRNATIAGPPSSVVPVPVAAPVQP